MPLTRPKAADPGQLVMLLERRLNAERAERRRLQEQLAKIEVRAIGFEASDSRELSMRLEELIEQRTKALSIARDEAVAASHSKSSFLANMSHEIRTPLTSIIGFAELLQDPRVAAAEKIDAAQTIVRNGRHLLEVINDILDLSKIESNRLSLERIEVPLPKLLSDIEALASSRATEKSLRFTIAHHLPLPPALVSDSVRLKQILLNFCSNAIKFSTQGEVRLDVRYDADAATLRFDVSDTGIGMSEADLARLFKPFVQADVSTTRRFGGTGLGLYISKQLADLLGGRIDVRSTLGLGSCFSLTVPVGVPLRSIDLLSDRRDFGDVHRPAFQVTSIEIPKLNGRVLVAEDGPDNQRLLASYLRQAGVEFDIVGNGALAVERAGAQPYALVLMDIQMPVMDGVSATKALRGANYAGPIVALTANVMQDDVMLYRSVGCDDVLGKPIHRAQFYAVLEKFLEFDGGGEENDEDGDEDGDERGARSCYEDEFAALTAEFVAGLPNTFAAVDAALEAGDRDALERLLHTLKGTAGSYGLHALSAAAARAEAALPGNCPGALADACGGLRAALAPGRDRSISPGAAPLFQGPR